MQAGIDEAGRGPVIGPLVVALVATSTPERLKDLGVRDSKTLAPQRRETIDHLIRREFTVDTIALSADDLDQAMKTASLNDVEAVAFSQLMARNPATDYYVDACDVDASRFGNKLRALASLDASVRIISEHQADQRHPVVSAASIVAKVERDRAVAEIAQRLEPLLELPLGSGYSHDEKTRAFLRAWVKRFGALPADARKRWETSRALMQERAQRKLMEFGHPPA